MSFEGSHLYSFEDFRLDPSESVLERRGEQIPITPKAFQMLQILVENHGHVVKKERLMSEIWSDSFVEEGNLAYTARLLRKALDDDAKHPLFIETVPRKGYRFIAGVSEIIVTLTDAPAQTEPDHVVDYPGRKRSFAIGPLWRPVSIAAIVVFVGLAAWLLINRTVFSSLSATPVLNSPFSATQLFSSGNAAHAAISPNGKFVVYTDRSNGKWSLWLRQLATAENIQIVPPADVFYGGLVFSRDGNSIFFVRGDTKQKQLDIYRVNTFGGIPTKLIEGTQGWISIGPDDKKISFIRCTYKKDSSCSLYVADADGWNERLLATRAEPLRIADNQFSPDGRSIVFAAGESRTASNGFGLYRIDIETGTESEMTPQKFFNIKYLRWLPDGSGLLVTARENLVPKFSIWNISAVTGVSTMLTRDDANFSGLSLDAEGRTIVATKVSNDFNIYLENPAEPNSRKLLAAGLNPNFSPDGKIVYRSADLDIWSIEADGTGKRQLTSDPAADLHPIVSRDARHIFFTSNRSGANQIWRMNIDGTDQRQVTKNVGGYVRFITPAGDWIYYRSPVDNSCWKVAVDGGDEMAVPELDDYADAFSPDGEMVAYFVKSTEGREIGIRRVYDQTLVRTIKIADSDGIEPVHLEWSADGRSLNYLTKEQGKYSLWRWPLDGKSSVRISRPSPEHVEQITFGPRTTSFVTVRGNWIHDAFVITGLRY